MGTADLFDVGKAPLPLVAACITDSITVCCASMTRSDWRTSESRRRICPPASVPSGSSLP